MYLSKKKLGFATLFIVIILGSLALSFTLLLSVSSMWSIQNSADSKISNIARSLVNACGEVALETIRENNDYVGTNTVHLNGNTCAYTISNTGGDTRSIVISGSIGSITRKLNINTSSINPITVSSWEEVP